MPLRSLREPEAEWYPRAIPIRCSPSVSRKVRKEKTRRDRKENSTETSTSLTTSIERKGDFEEYDLSFIISPQIHPFSILKNNP